ncbi:MAG: aromatic amino acid transport family protein [Patescibacteria group bacterium]
MPQFKTLKGLGLLVGMIIGAGMFALPYAIARAGFWWGTFHFVLAALLVTCVHLLYGKVLFQEHTRHRLPGYVREYVGEGAYWFALCSRFFAYFGYLLAYGVLGGLFLNHFLSHVSASFLSVLFFIVAAPFILLKPAGVGSLNLFFNAFLVFFIVVLFVALVPQIDISSPAPIGNSYDWFFPYGIFLFAFSGASVIPELVDLFGRGRERRFRQTVYASTAIVACVYILFIVAVLGIAHGNVSEDGLSSIKEFGGQGLFLIGSLIGFLAVADSYIDIGLELRYTLEYDLNFKKYAAWVIVVVLPPMLFLMGINNFVKIIAVTGAVGVGIEGVCIALLARKTIHTCWVFVFLLSAAFTIGAIISVAQVL